MSNQVGGKNPPWQANWANILKQIELCNALPIKTPTVTYRDESLVGPGENNGKVNTDHKWNKYLEVPWLSNTNWVAIICKAQN